MTATGIFYVFAHVSELEASKRFYGEVLGWHLNTDQPGVAGYGFGSGYLVLRQDDRPEGARPYAGGMHVTVRVEDAEAEHDRLEALGVPVTTVAQTPWGERRFSFTDPDGYEWSFGATSGG